MSAGNQFIICVPSHKYEGVSVSKDEVNVDEEVDFDNNTEQDHKLENFAESKISQSTDEIELSESNDAPGEKELSEKRGSFDSDRNRRINDERDINQSAIDRFNTTNIQIPVLNHRSPMEKVMREIINKFKIKNASWVRVNNGNSYQITFSLEKGVRCDDTIHMLSEFKIGQKHGSSIAIIPCTLYRENHEEAASTSSQAAIKETAWNKFIGTVRARMNVAKIVVDCKESATLSFDFIVLLIVASILASFGLREDSTLFLAASMLISPLMGPIIAATFGAVIKDHKLQYWGMKNEIIGIFMCILVGFVFGLISCGINYIFSTDIPGLTSEMKTRTDFHSVIVGIFIALPSGAAVAIAVIGENFGSLVGVAISASLLPPAVNTGLLWSLSCVHKIFKEKGPVYKMESLSKTYSEDVGLELLTLGLISLCMTLTNVLCVYAMGFVFLKFKEVAPVSDDQRQFWKHDIKIARDYNKTVHADEGHKLQEELSQFQANTSDNFKGVGVELLRQSFRDNNWSTQRHHHKDSHSTRTSIRDLETIYSSIVDKSISSDKHHRNNPNISNVVTSSSSPAKRIQVESTLVSIEGPGTSGCNTKRFIVTPANDPLA